jgi:hypothetical protein
VHPEPRSSASAGTDLLITSRSIAQEWPFRHTACIPINLVRHLDLLDGASRASKHCFMKSDTLDRMVVFVAVAEAKNFRVAENDWT